jgi:hypothetical protein
MHFALLTAATVLWSVAALAQAERSGSSTAPAVAEPAVVAADTPTMPPLAEYVSPTDSLPRLRYLADGQVTINDRCPVRKVKLNPRMHAAYVNGRPVGFC